MAWMRNSDNVDPAECGLKIHGDKLIAVMTDINPATDLLVKMIHYNCTGGCNTCRCSCKKYGLECTTACEPCQDGSCEHMNNAPILDDNED